MNITKDVYDYAWNWFEYHATQRLLAFRYYLIFLGILAVVINNGLENNNYTFVSAVATLGCFVTVAFFILEIRNEGLVNVGRKALREIENSSGYPDNDALKLLHNDRKRNILMSHKMWLRMIYIVSVFAFGYAACEPMTLDGAEQGTPGQTTS